AKAHGLWVYHGQGRITAEVAQAFAKEPSPLVRTHLHRVLTETATWSPEMRKLAIAGLDDVDAFVQGAAGQGLAAHPRIDAADSLIDLRANVPSDDTHLSWTIRVALRDQLRDPETMADIRKVTARLTVKGDRFLPRKANDVVADVAPGVHSPAAASF